MTTCIPCLLLRPHPMERRQPPGRAGGTFGSGCGNASNGGWGVPRPAALCRLAPHPITAPLEARGAMLRLSLLQRVDGEAQCYRLHPLLREYFMGQWSGADQDGWSLAFAGAIGARARQVPREMSWEKAARYHTLQPHLPLAQQILQHRAATAPDSATATRYKTQAGDIQGAVFRLAQPVLFEATFARARTTHDQAKAAAAAGNVALARQKFTETLEAYRRVIEQARQTFPPDSLQLAGYLNRIARLFRELGRYQDGIPPAAEAVAIATDRAKPLKLASYLNDLASLYDYQGNYSEAEPLYGRSLAIWEQQLGADHPDVATSLNNLAGLYQAMGRYGEAEPLYLRALGIWVKALPENHPYIKGVFGNFRGMVQAALEGGQADQLSDHPTTQAVLQQLKSQQDH